MPRLPLTSLIGPIVIPTTPAPIEGLASNSNYYLYGDCGPIRDLTVTIHTTQDLVVQSSSGTTRGFSIQLNAYSPKGQHSAWQQYFFLLLRDDLQGGAESWIASGATSLFNARVHLLTIPDFTIPAHHELEIALHNADDGTINGSTFTVTRIGMTPQRGSALNGYVGSNGDQHVNFVGTDGHLHELFIRPGGQWVNNDLNLLSGNSIGPIDETALAGYTRSGGDQHIFFVGTDGHLRELHIEPNGQWENNDLNLLSQSNIVPAPDTDIDAYWGIDGDQHVNFIGADGHVHEMYLASGAQWVNNDLTLKSNSQVLPAPATRLTGYFGENKGQHVIYIANDGHIHELYIHPGADWLDNDLTALSRKTTPDSTPPLAGSDLHGYSGTDGNQHINFIGIDGHIHELLIHPHGDWINNDLTQLAGNGIAPNPTSAIDSYRGPDQGQHVNFIGLDGHVHELYLPSGGQWVNNDLMALSGSSTVPFAATALDGYWGDSNGQHVNFISDDGHLHELYIHPNASWVDNDLNRFVLITDFQDLTGMSAAKLAPITTFQLNMVGPIDGETTIFSSGQGIITYAATTPMTVLNYQPDCTDAFLVTAEKANTVYGQMFTGPANVLTQSFSVMPPARSARGGTRHLHRLPAK